MKLLAINCSPNLSYFENRGLHIDVTSITVPNLVFSTKYLYDIKDQNGAIVPVYTPWVEDYLNLNYPNFDYSFILVGWKPSDYPSTLSHTGGYTYFKPLKSGTFWSTVRQDTIPINLYPLHELHHALCDVIYTIRGTKDISHIDFMDSDRLQRPYFLNDQPENPLSNYAQTWEGIKPYLPQLNSIKYTPQLPIVTLTRLYDYGKETVGRLDAGNFTCNTLELGFHNNQTNVSSIPKGNYIIKWTFSPRFLRYVYQIQNVPGRSGIDIHSANLYAQLLGCIALGRGYSNLDSDGLPDILNSRDTVKEFETWGNKRDLILNIL